MSRHVYSLIVDCRNEDLDVLATLVELAQGWRGELVLETGEFVGRRVGVTEAVVGTIVPRSDEQDPDQYPPYVHLEVRPHA